MRKSVISLVLSVSLICSLLPANGIGQKAFAATGTEKTYAISGTCGDNAEWFINSDATLVIHGSGSTSGEPWRIYRKDIKRVVVEDGITSLELRQFAYCESMTEIVFSPTVTHLNSCLASELPELEDIWVYSADVENTFALSSGEYPRAGSGTKWHIYEDTTTERSLRDGLKLTDEDIEYITEDQQQFPAIDNRTPASLPEVTDTSGISGLLSEWKWDGSTQTLTFSGKGTISIPDGYYEKYKETAKHIIIESGITSVDASTGIKDILQTGAFYGFTALEDAELPDTLRKIGSGTFRDCSSFTRLVFGLPESLEEIGNAAFMESSLSGDIILPQTVNSIGDYGFSGTDIASVELHEGMTLGGGCFRDCDSLREVTIPGGIYFQQTPTSNAPRPASTFSGCDLLEKVVIEGAGTAPVGVGGDNENALPPSLFAACQSLKEIRIETEELAYVAGKSSGSPTFGMTNNPTFKLYKGSTTEATLSEAGYLTAENTEYLDVDTLALEEAVTRAEGIDKGRYTEESVGAVNEALAKAKEVLNQEYPLPSVVEETTKALNDVLSALKAKPSTGSSDNTTKKPTDTTSTEKDKAAKAAQAAKDKSNAEKAMKNAKVTKLTVKSKAKKKLKVTWKKVKKATGYEVQVSTKKNFKKKIFDKFTTKKALTFSKKIKSKQKYYVRVRAYSTYKDADGVTRKVYGKWSKKLSIKAK